jgi:flavin reductase (DIM6/NTAB) family NADH-FMN oxidoreductase RutF
MKPIDRSDSDSSTAESIFYEPRSRDRQILPHDPFKALVAPRPIGWISTLGPGGETNLAPYSFFNAVGTDPPMLAFSSTGMKDSATFAIERGEFVWNLVTWDLREQMSDTSASLERGDCEFLYSGLEMAPSRLVKAPRVAASPCSMECKVVQASELQDLDGRGVDQYLIIGQVVGIHLDESAIVDGVVDTAQLRSIARCGGLTDYAVVDSLFELPRRALPPD